MFSGADPFGDGLKFRDATLLTEAWETIRSINMTDSGDGMFTGKSTVPDKPFRVLVKGSYNDITRGATDFERLQASLYIPAYADIVIDGSLSAMIIRIDQEQLIKFRVTNYGPSTSVQLEARDTGGLVRQMTPSTNVTLGTNETATVIVTLFANSSTTAKGASIQTCIFTELVLTKLYLRLQLKGVLPH